MSTCGPPSLDVLFIDNSELLGNSSRSKHSYRDWYLQTVEDIVPVNFQIVSSNARSVGAAVQSKNAPLTVDNDVNRNKLLVSAMLRVNDQRN